MNPKLKIANKCKVYLYDKEKEGREIYIEGIVKEVDEMAGNYLINCLKDCTLDDSVVNETTRKALSRVNEDFLIPIQPETGDFLGRIVLIS